MLLYPSNRIFEYSPASIEIGVTVGFIHTITALPCAGAKSTAAACLPTVSEQFPFRQPPAPRTGGKGKVGQLNSSFLFLLLAISPTQRPIRIIVIDGDTY